MTEKKVAANRRNARKSTGPKSLSGKKAVSQNARRHGLLSTHLILEDESRHEFDLLLSTLQQEMQPVGLIEQTLVERIAITLWRQRRLVRAESADVELKQRLFDPKNLQMAATSLGLPISDKRLKESISNPYSTPKGNSEGKGKLLAQLLELSDCRDDLSLEVIEEAFPLAYRELLWAADGTLVGLVRKMAEEGIGFKAYVDALVPVVKKQYDSERIKELIALYRDSAQVRTSVDLIGRYQSTLDNELYKALRALREAQNWRVNRLDAEARHVDAGVSER